MHSSAAEALTQILVVNDDIAMCRLIREYLEPIGYNVLSAHTLQQGLQMALRQPFAVLIVDVMMPSMDGFSLLKRLREESNVPVLMLTGRSEESDRIIALELGADDCLPETFSARELLARLRALIRRSIMTQSKQQK
jgi:DNA-binding response OmpR family regulator